MAHYAINNLQAVIQEHHSLCSFEHERTKRLYGSLLPLPGGVESELVVGRRPLLCAVQFQVQVAL